MLRKRLLIAFLLCCLLLGACGNRQNPTDPTDATTQPTTQPTEPPHIHTFGEWGVQTLPDCKQDFPATRVCTDCGYQERGTVPATNHNMNDKGICEDCWYVEFDDSAEIAELGVMTDQWFIEGQVVNTVWDVKVWDGKVYRGSGDYDINSGKTMILAYNIQTRRWEDTGTADDEAIQRFVEIGDTLYAPGLDPLESWELGNYYVLKNGTWEKFRNLPNGIHVFDMTEFDGKLFAGLGTDYRYNTTAYSTDGGKTFQYAQMYKDGKLFDAETCEYTRNYEFMEYKGQLYGLMRYVKNVGSDHEFYRYEDGKMVYVGDASGYAGGRKYSRNYFGGKFEFNGLYYLTAGYLYAISDFSGDTDGKIVKMPGNEGVVDAMLKDGVIYVLATAPADEGHKVAIYRSSTGQEGSFEEVISFNYPVMPCSFDMDGKDFYIGMGVDEMEEIRSGMLVRVRPAA